MHQRGGINKELRSSGATTAVAGDGGGTGNLRVLLCIKMGVNARPEKPLEGRGKVVFEQKSFSIYFKRILLGNEMNASLSSS